MPSLDNIGFYIVALLAVIVAAFVVKKTTSCLVRLVTILVAIGVLLAAYYLLVGHNDPEVQRVVHEHLPNLKM